jgi:hypothetical protein
VKQRCEGQGCRPQNGHAERVEARLICSGRELDAELRVRRPEEKVWAVRREGGCTTPCCHFQHIAHRELAARSGSCRRVADECVARVANSMNRQESGDDRICGDNRRRRSHGIEAGGRAGGLRDSGPYRVMLTEPDVERTTEPTLRDFSEALIAEYGTDYGVPGSAARITSELCERHSFLRHVPMSRTATLWPSRRISTSNVTTSASPAARPRSPTLTAVSDGSVTGRRTRSGRGGAAQ